jgi:hypothetical protein
MVSLHPNTLKIRGKIHKPTKTNWDPGHFTMVF